MSPRRVTEALVFAAIFAWMTAHCIAREYPPGAFVLGVALCALSHATYIGAYFVRPPRLNVRCADHRR